MSLLSLALAAQVAASQPSAPASSPVVPASAPLPPASSPVEPAPEASPAPLVAVAPAARAVTLRVEAQLFASFRAASLGGEAQNQFDLDRGELGLRYGLSDKAGLVLRAEAIRSASPESFFGVDGDSIVARVNRAYGFGTYALGPVRLEGRLGLIRDPWIELLETSYPLRPVSASMAERGGFFSPADLGAALYASAFEGRLELRYASTNGEGLRRQEQNTGKDSTLVLSAYPLATATTRIGVHGLYRDGSLGTALAPDHRAAGAVSLSHPRLKAGAELEYAIGFQSQADRRAAGFGAWASATPYWEWLGLVGRVDHYRADTSLEDGAQRTVSAGASALLPMPGLASVAGVPPNGLSLFVVYQRERAEAQAGPVPGASAALDADRVMLILAAQVASER